MGPGAGVALSIDAVKWWWWESGSQHHRKTFTFRSLQMSRLWVKHCLDLLRKHLRIWQTQSHCFRFFHSFLETPVCGLRLSKKVLLHAGMAILLPHHLRSARLALFESQVFKYCTRVAHVLTQLVYFSCQVFLLLLSNKRDTGAPQEGLELFLPCSWTCLRPYYETDANFTAGRRGEMNSKVPAWVLLVVRCSECRRLQRAQAQSPEREREENQYWEWKLRNTFLNCLRPVSSTLEESRSSEPGTKCSAVTS